MMTTYTNYAFHMWDYQPVSKTEGYYTFDTNIDEYGVYHEIDLTSQFVGSSVLGVIIKSVWVGTILNERGGGHRFILTYIR